MARPRKLTVKSGAQRKFDYDQRKRLGVTADCRFTRYTPEGQISYRRFGLDAFTSCPVRYRGDQRLSGMPVEQGFHKSSCIRRPYNNGPSANEYDLPATPTWRWPHPLNVERRPINAGHIPTADQHRQRRERLRFVGKWCMLWRNPRHGRYYLDALQDACEMIAHRSKPARLSDESLEANERDDDLTALGALFAQQGTRLFTSADKAHYQWDDPGSVKKEDFAKEAERLRRRAPKSLKTKRGKPYIAARHWNDDHYPPPSLAPISPSPWPLRLAA
jgi:hypothetical protein